MLEKNSFEVKEAVVKVTGKRIQAKVHDRMMLKVRWKDGGWRHVHVDVVGLKAYQRKLEEVEEELEHVLVGLETGSRKVFGNLCEER